MSKQNPAVQSGKTDGGPAFGTTMGTGATDKLCMSLRDYFAAKAMAALLGNTDAVKAIESLSNQPDEVIVKAAYGTADAMLVERRSK